MIIQRIRVRIKGHERMIKIRMTIKIKIKRRVELNKQEMTQTRVIMIGQKRHHQKTVILFRLLMIDLHRKTSPEKRAPLLVSRSMFTITHRKTRWRKVYKSSRVHQTISLKRSFKKFTQS